MLRPGVSIEQFRRSRGKGFKIGTNAVRRAAYARRLFPEVEVIHYRGAADTRVRKLDHLEKQRLPDGGEVGPADALIMARSGLERVGLAGRIAYEFSIQEMLPAVGQGIVAVECAVTRLANAGYSGCDRRPRRAPQRRRRARGAVGAQRPLQFADRGIFHHRGRADVADGVGAGRSRRRCSSKSRAPGPPIARANSAARSGSNSWPRAQPRSSSAAGRDNLYP